MSGSDPNDIEARVPSTFIVAHPAEPDYVFIEANERPGLANHEPQPTAERFIDLLFPQSMPAPARDFRRLDASASH